MQVIRHHRYPAHNLSDIERAVSMATGAWIAWKGLRRGSSFGYVLALAGGELIRRGAMGSCPLYSALGISTASRGQGAETTSVPYEVGIRVDESVIIKRRPEEIFRFWRDLTNLPRILSHVHRVEVSGNRSHWTVNGPAGQSLEWDAEIINEVENRLIAWRSLPGAQVDNAGSVHFHSQGPDATRVQVVLQYNPPAGVAGALIAKLWGEEPSQQIRNDLRELKRSLEAAVPIL